MSVRVVSLAKPDGIGTTKDQTMKTQTMKKGAFSRPTIPCLLLGLVLPIAGTIGVQAQSMSPNAPAQNAQEASGQQEIQKQLKRVKTDLSEVESRIQMAQRVALTTEPVRQEKAKYDDKLRGAIVEKEPALEPVVEKQQELLNELLDSPELAKAAQEQSSEFKEKVTEYTELNRKIEPVAQEAVQDPDVMQSYQEYQRTLTQEMEVQDPEIPQLLAQRNNLRSQYQQLMQATQ